MNSACWSAGSGRACRLHRRSPLPGPRGRRASSPGRRAAVDRDAVQDVIFLSDARPIFIRLRLDAGGKAFRSAWLDAVKAIHAYLDREQRRHPDQG